jgi:hypothetical protein
MAQNEIPSLSGNLVARIEASFTLKGLSTEHSELGTHWSSQQLHRRPVGSSFSHKNIFKESSGYGAR